jgi:hypothetical protein
MPTFGVSATGDGPLTYQWFRNEAVINGATSPILTLPPVHSADAGRYTVRVSSTNGHAISPRAVLTIFSMLQSRELEISGPLGQSYRIDSRLSLDATNGWTVLTNFALPNSPFLFIDGGSSNSSTRFYRATAVP